MIRFEILLPLFYNDGRPIEPEKFVATDDDLVATFGATSTDQITVRALEIPEHHLFRPVDSCPRGCRRYRGQPGRNACSQRDAKVTVRSTRHLDHGPSN